MNDDWKIYLYGGEVMLKTYEIQDGRTPGIGSGKGTLKTTDIRAQRELSLIPLSFADLNFESQFIIYGVFSTAHAFSTTPTKNLLLTNSTISPVYI